MLELRTPQRVNSVRLVGHRTDEIWGYVVEILADGEFIIELTEIESDNQDEYGRYEQVLSEQAMVDNGDFVHVWVHARDAVRRLHGLVVVEEVNETEDLFGQGWVRLLSDEDDSA